jgi:dihydroneopterin aldolase
MKTDILVIKKLRLDTRIGVYDWEKVARQTLWLDLELHVSSEITTRAAASDNVQDALDYVAVSERLQQFASGSSCELIETFAERVADVLLSEFSVQKVLVSAYKPSALASTDSVVLMIERCR